jgi:hypothetical protein
MAIAVLYLAYGVWRIRRGLAEAATFLAWTTALTIWAVALAFARDLAVASGTIPFRYQYVALGFVLLAVVPRRPIRWPGWLPVATNPRWIAASAVGLLVLGLVGAAALKDDMDRRAEYVDARGDRTIGELVLLDVGSEVVPDHETMSPAFFGLTPDEVRRLVRRYGGAPRGEAATVDERLVELGTPPVDGRDPPAGRCEDGGGEAQHAVVAGDANTFWSDAQPWSVDVRRFGEEWVPLVSGEAGEAAWAHFPRLGSEVPWEVRTHDACIVEAEKPIP